MRKILFGIIVVIVVGIVVVSLPKQTEGMGSNEQKEEDDVIRVETLSDDDIYFKADTIVIGNPVVSDMIDLANAYAIMRAVYCDAELWLRFGMSVNDEIESVRTGIIQDQAIRTEMEKYVKTISKLLPNDTTSSNESDSLIWDKVWEANMSLGNKLSSRYALSNYGEITGKDVENYLDMKQFIPNYDTIRDLRRKQSEENERILRMMAEQTMYFDRECIFTIEYAHQRRFDKSHPAIPMLEKLMESGKYSRYLHEVWRTWRCLKQVGLSPSRDGMIPNLEYNKMRYRCLDAILKQIAKNPKDIYAINDFCFLATYDNITRYSEFVFGNSAPLEQMTLFPEILEDCNDDESETNGEDVTDTAHNTKSQDTLIVPKQEVDDVDAKWLRRQFEIPVRAYWKNYEDGYGVEYPAFMERMPAGNGGRNLHVEYQGISMIVSTYDEKYDMSVREKFEAIGQSAVTTSLADNSFTLAGSCGKNKLYFEKDLLLKPRTWIYLRVEFPSELTWAVDPLLHYVKDYRP